MDFLFASLHWLGFTVYGGSLIAFALLMLAARLLDPVEIEKVMRVWRYWGAGLGVSMGALIFGGLARYYQLNGGFSWPLDTTAQQLTAAKHAAFLLLWASSFHLEIWTLEPLRKLERAGDPGPWDAAAARVTRQATFNAVLFVVVGLLALAARG
jgi:uncharacterized membrane protein